MPQIDVDVSTVEAREAFDVLPAGKYMVAITESDVRTTKRGDGSYLELVLTVLDGPHKGRKLWDRLNLWNSNAQASEIAHRTLRAITDSIGHAPTVKNSETLHDKPLVAHAKIVKQEGYQDKNEVAGYSAVNGQARPAPQAAPTPPKAAPAAAPTKAPWKK